MTDPLKKYEYYRNENGVLYCGDCLEIMPHLPKVDLVLTDPPYGVSMDKGFGGVESFGGRGMPIARKQYADSWDSTRPSKEHFKYIIDLAKLIMIFGGNYFFDILPQSTHWIVWDKKNTMPSFGDAELIWTNIPRKSVKIIECEYNGLLGKEGKRVHPTQKPLKLMIELIEKYLSGTCLADPFAGSGTSLIACERLNRKWIGIEISEEYCAIAKKRIEKERQQLRLF